MLPCSSYSACRLLSRHNWEGKKWKPMATNAGVEPCPFCQGKRIQQVAALAFCTRRRGCYFVAVSGFAFLRVSQERPGRVLVMTCHWYKAIKWLQEVLQNILRVVLPSSRFGGFRCARLKCGCDLACCCVAGHNIKKTPPMKQSVKEPVFLTLHVGACMLKYCMLPQPLFPLHC